MKTVWISAVGSSLLLCDQAAAADWTVAGILPVALNAVILAGAFGCLIIAFKLYNLVKGGALARGCQMWLFSFITLAAGQAVALAEKLGLLAINFDIAALLYVGTVILWFFGLIQTRKVLE